MEVGGLLLGQYTDGHLRITGWEAVECEHASGPSFLLSRNDEAAVREHIQQRKDIVGWYHSHTRSGIHFSADDLAVHQRLFPGPAQIALVLYPNAGTVVRVGVFFRETNGRVIRNSELVHEFAVAMDAGAPSSPAPPVPGRIAAGTNTHRNSVWAGLAAMLALAIGAVLFVRLHNTASGQAPERFIRLEAVGHGDQVDVRWDPRSLGAVRTAKLAIRDGAQQSEIPLDAKTLRAGLATYVRQSEVTSIRIRVERVDGEALEGSTTLVAPIRVMAAAVGKAGPEVQPQPSPVTIESSPQSAAASPAAVFQAPRRVTPELTPNAILDPPSSVSVGEQRSSGLPGGTPALPAPPPKQAAIAPLQGRWEFRPGAATRSPAAPEAITISVSEDNGQIQGTLEARYKDAHAKTEHVQFSFAGKAGSPARFPWKNAEGVRGEIELIRVPNAADSIEVVWFDSDAKRIFDDVLKKVN